MRERYLRSIRLLAECFQAFEQTSGRHVRTLGLTPAQFDIVVTLGRTAGMSCRALGERTLITKGTLTGVLALGLVRAGLPEGSVYDGSWTEWALRPETPKATGSAA